MGTGIAQSHDKYPDGEEENAEDIRLETKN
jgi:hypothetical protein